MRYSVNMVKNDTIFLLKRPSKHCSVPCLMLSLCAQSFYDYTVCVAHF